MWWKCESQIHHKILAKHILRHCDKNVMIMWLGKKIYESHLHHNFITILKVMKMWRKCDELTLVLILWLLSFENSRHGKKVDDHQRWRKEMTVCSGLLWHRLGGYYKVRAGKSKYFKFEHFSWSLVLHLHISAATRYPLSYFDWIALKPYFTGIRIWYKCNSGPSEVNRHFDVAAIFIFRWISHVLRRWRGYGDRGSGT